MYSFTLFGNCAKGKWRSPVTMHNHVTSKRASEPVDPDRSQLTRKAYMCTGGGDRDEPMLDRMKEWGNF